MAMRPPMPSMRLSRRSKILLGVIGTIVVLLVLASSLSGYYLDYQWFGEVGQRGVFTSILVTRLVLFAVFGVIMAVVIGVNLVIAYRLRPPFRPMSPEQQNLERYRNRIEPRRGLLLGLLLALFGIVTGLSMQGGWQLWTLWMNGVSFGQKDPQFNLDVSFYAFDYPVYRAMLGFAFTAIVFAFLLSLIVHYVFGAVRLQTPGPKMTLAARRHLTVLVFVFVALKAVAYWLDRYSLVFSTRGQGFSGASYTDINAALPAKTILFYVAIVIALAVLASMWLRSVLIPTTAFVVLLVLSVLANGIYPAVVQQFRVKPNANVLERQYIANNIAATRQAYDVVTRSDAGGEKDAAGTVDYASYQATSNPDVADLVDTNPTVANIRVLDPNVLSDTFTVQQNLRPFYGFPTKLDIDRYTTDDETRDYIVSVRELKGANLTGDQANWINQYTRYTHGYGFVAAAANSDVTNSRIYDEGDIPTKGFLSGADGDGYQPRVYYGEDMPEYSVVGATGRNAEYDAIDDNNTYDGKGGVGLGSLVNRVAFAANYRQLSFLLNDVATAPGAKVIFDRDPRQRVEKVAPWLKVDGDPYPAVVGGRTVWFVDGYTTMNNYPYSQSNSLSDLTSDTLTALNRSAVLPDDDINYIRNSVKATVDAYDGTVTLYQWDTEDPLLKTWMKAFPGLIHPKSELEDQTDLVSHVRYPEDLFNVQRSILQRYHVDDPVAFYNASSQWTIPADATQGQAANPNQPPYYVQASPPTDVADGSDASADASTSTFQLTSPMKVQNRTNLAAFISVDSTPGDDYGKMTILQVPTSSVVKGPEQVFNDLTSQANIRSDLTLLRSAESRVTYGNLLTLPIGDSFLNVIPVYVQSTAATGFPILQRVMVSYGEKQGYASTLAGALANLAPGQVTGQSVGNGATSSPSASNSSSPPGSTSPPGSSSPTTGATGPVDQQLAALGQQIASLAVQLNAANKAGDYTKAGQLQAQLAALADQYGKLQASASSSPTAPATSASPTPSTSTSGG